VRSLWPVIVVLGLASGAQAQSMDGWQRLPDLQLTFERDHAACTALGGPPPTTPNNWRGQSADAGFRSCMRSRGWVKGTP
jgi:hypothetical protein